MSSASAAKSADRIEGAILSTAFHCNTGSALRALVGCAARRSGQPLAGRPGNELPGAHALHREQLVGSIADLPRVAGQHADLETGVFVAMDVAGGGVRPEAMVLDVRQLV